MSIFGNHGRAESSKSQHQPLQTLSFNQTAQRLVYIPLVEGNSSFKREATEKTLIYEVKKYKSNIILLKFKFKKFK